MSSLGLVSFPGKYQSETYPTKKDEPEKEMYVTYWSEHSEEILPKRP